MSLQTRLLETPWVYRLWQSGFAEQKLAPVWAAVERDTIRRVLDVGCGPGTNTRHFAAAEYLGVDLNPRYIAAARHRYRRTFQVVDVCELDLPHSERFDFILVNSLLHHLATPDVERLLASLGRLLTDTGRVHILELVRPERPGIAACLARWDRGRYARPLGEWRALFTAHLVEHHFEPYALTAGGRTLWQMVYFQGGKQP